MKIATQLNIQNNTVNAAPGSKSDSESSAELLDQFAALMDKIAAQVTRSSQEVPAVAPSTFEERKSPVSENPQVPNEPVVQAESPEQSSIEPQVQDDEDLAKPELAEEESTEQIAGEESEQLAAENESSSEVVESEESGPKEIESQTSEATSQASSQSAVKPESVIKNNASEVVEEAPANNAQAKVANPQSSQQSDAQAQLPKNGQPVVQQEAQIEGQAVSKQQGESAPKAVAATQVVRPEAIGKEFLSLLESAGADIAKLAQVVQSQSAPQTTDQLVKLIQSVFQQIRSEFGGASVGQGLGLSGGSFGGAGSQGGTHQNADLASSLLKNNKPQTERNQESSEKRPLRRHEALRTLERVQEVLKEAAKSRDGKTISLRLDPPSLGQVRADVSLRDGVLHARLSAENSQVGQLLREKAAELVRILRDSGLNVDQVTVSVGSEQNQDANLSFAEFASKQQDRELNEFFQGGEGVLVEGAALSEGQAEQPVIDHWVA